MSCFNRCNNSCDCDDLSTTIVSGVSENNNNNCCGCGCNCCNCGCGNVAGTSCNRRCGNRYYVTNSECDCEAEETNCGCNSNNYCG